MRRTKFTILIALICILGTLLSHNYYPSYEVVKNEEKYAAIEWVTVSSWTELSNAISNNKQYIKIKASNSDNWKANSTITITRDTTIRADDSNTGTLVITRNTTNFLFDVNGVKFTLEGQDNKDITIDGSYSTETKAIINIAGNGNVTLTKVSLKNNKSSSNGGAITMAEGKLTLQGSSLTNNKGKFGGAIYVSKETSTLSITNSFITGNESTQGSGGGVYAYGTLTVQNSEITNNTSATYGGGLMIKTQATVKNSKINNNTATANAGGGIRVDGTAAINNCEVKNNKSADGGAGIDISTSHDVTVSNNTYANNLVGTNEVDLFPDINSANNVDWKNDTSLKLEEINLEFVKNYKVDGTGELAPHSGYTQGLTMTDKYVLLVQWVDNAEPTVIHVIDKNNFTHKNSIVIDAATYGYTFGHGNDLAYDSKTGYVYVYTSQKNSNNKVQMAKFKINNNGEMTDLSFFDAPRGVSGIAVDNDHDQFIVYSGGKIFIYDKSFNEKSNFSVPTNLTTQGIAYWKGYIYFACYEAGSSTIYQTIFNYNEKGSNLIYVYDLEGNLVKTFYLSNRIARGELEDVEFFDSGEMLMNYNLSGITIFRSDYTTQVKDVYIKTEPSKKQYAQNSENIDLEGLVLGVVYNNETETQAGPSGVTVEGFDNSVVGTQTIYLIYQGKRIPMEIEIVRVNADPVPEKPKEKEDNPGTGESVKYFIIVLGMLFISLLGFNGYKKYYRI